MKHMCEYRTSTLRLRDLAGFTPGQGEQLRRALGNKRADHAIAQLHDAFVAGAQAKGIPTSVANAVFDQLRAFGGYAFPKSHAAAFAVIVYQSAWLKCYYPAAFYCAILRNQPMGFWPPSVIVGDARRHGIPMLPVDIAQSAMRCSLEGDGIHLGLDYVAGFGTNHRSGHAPYGSEPRSCAPHSSRRAA